MDSLYGGQPGVDFVLKASFKSVEDMVKAFAKGADWTDVWYGEYVIIDTPNKNHKDNGQIYRRGLNHQNSVGGAEYIGQVVGPSSGTPYFQLASLQDVQAISQKAQEDEYDYKRYPIAKNEDGTYQTDDAGDIFVDSFGDANKTSLVPGRYYDDAGKAQYNDDIRYTWVNIRKANQESDSWFYVGIESPYMVTDYIVNMVSAYDEYGQVTDKTVSSKRIDDLQHPFYAEWQLDIPKGIKGDTLRNLRVITPTKSDKIYDFTAIEIDKETGTANITKEPGYVGIEDDIVNERQIVVFDYYVYDILQNPEPIMIYLGDFNIIENIQVADDGTLSIAYTHNDTDDFTKKIQWIDQVELNPDTGDFTVTYNNDAEEFSTTLDWIKDITLDSDGTLHFKHTKNNRDEIHSNAIKWVNSTTLDNQGEFRTVYNYGDDYVTHLDWVKNIIINEETGVITVSHANPSIGDVASLAKLKMIIKAEASANGIVTFKTNTGESFNIKETNSENDFHIKTVENIVLDTNILNDQRIQIKYNTENTISPIGSPINYVKDMVVRSTDYHLLVLFNDPTHRAVGADLVDNHDANGNYWYNNIVGSDGTIYDPSIYWRDFGAIKDQGGILIGFGVTDADLDPGENILDYLERKYSGGLSGENNTLPNGINVAGKIITYSHNQGDKQEFYAFDYNKSKWYYLGEIADSDKRDAAIWFDTSKANDDATLNNLSKQGLMFQEKTFKVNDNPIPEYWNWDFNNWNQ